MSESRSYPFIGNRFHFRKNVSSFPRLRFWFGGTILTAFLFLAGNGWGESERVTFSRDFAPSEGWVKPVEQPYRQEMCLNGSWEFQVVPLPPDWKRESGVVPKLPLPTPDRWETTRIKIPSPWNVNTWGAARDVGEGTAHPYWPSSMYYPSYPPLWDGVEMGWLRRAFRVPQEWGDRRVVLHFEAVGGQAQVFVNGTKVGEHFGTHLPFEFDITPLVKRDGENELLVGVRSVRLFDKLSARFKNMRSPYPPGSNTDALCGIWQDVFLLGLPAVRAEEPFVKPFVDRDTLETDVTLRNDSSREETLEIEGSVQPWVNLAGDSILDAPEPKWRLDAEVMKLSPKRVSLKPGETQIVTLSEKVGGRLRFWSPDAPNLYGLVLTVKNGAQLVDRQYTRFGWRQLKIAGSDVLLNGQKIQMFGDLLHPFGPLVNSRRYVWAWYKMIKDMHGNAVRPHAQPHPRHYLDLADEMGLLVLDETAMFGSSLKMNFEEPVAWERFAEQYDALIRRDRNHPSVFGWSWGNELFAIFIYDKAIGPEQTDAWYRQLAELGNRGHRLDPTRDWFSCDGDEDVRGSMPVWNKHFGHGLPDLALLEKNAQKPRMIGESGGSYYARPSQLAEFNGDRAYESYLGRNEALAIDVYDNIVRVALPKLAFYSPAETAWFGLEHLNYGYRDFTRLPNPNDGVWLKPFEEGKPGIQPERIPPYVATLNPGWDPDLPLYKPLSMFEAQKAALTKDSPQNCPWNRKPEIKKTETPIPAPTIESVTFVGTPDGKLHKSLTDLGLPLAETNTNPSPKLLALDAETVTEAMFADMKPAIQTTLENQGTVLVLLNGNASVPVWLNAFLPAPLTLSARQATALIPRSSHAWTNGLGLPDLYFAEDETEKRILKQGLDGEFLKKGQILLEASNTDWSLFHDMPESAKCGAVVLYESLIKPSGAAMVEAPCGRGKVVVSVIEVNPASKANRALWRRIFANAGVRLREPGTVEGKSIEKEHNLLLDGPPDAAK
jgi:beta-galactosidase